jgi:hypothetical protein
VSIDVEKGIQNILLQELRKAYLLQPHPTPSFSTSTPTSISTCNTSRRRTSRCSRHHSACWAASYGMQHLDLRSEFVLMDDPRKRPWRLSPMQKARQRKRLRLVDRVVDTVNAALQKNGMSSKAIDRWYAEMPREEEMLPKDKYTIFDRKEKTYRKGIHSMLLI